MTWRSWVLGWWERRSWRSCVSRAAHRHRHRALVVGARCVAARDTRVMRRAMCAACQQLATQRAPTAMTAPAVTVVPSPLCRHPPADSLHAHRSHRPAGGDGGVCVRVCVCVCVSECLGSRGGGVHASTADSWHAVGPVAARAHTRTHSCASEARTLLAPPHTPRLRVNARHPRPSAGPAVVGGAAHARHACQHHHARQHAAAAAGGRMGRAAAAGTHLCPHAGAMGCALRTRRHVSG
jgi:hypothetical protein